MPRRVEQATDYILICTADRPTRNSKKFVRNLRNCTDICEASSLAACIVIEETDAIAEVVGSYQFNFMVGHRSIINANNS